MLPTFFRSLVTHGLTRLRRFKRGRNLLTFLAVLGLVRFSVGCEDFEDLREDLEQALARI